MGISDLTAPEFFRIIQSFIQWSKLLKMVQNRTFILNVKLQFCPKNIAADIWFFMKNGQWIFDLLFFEFGTTLGELYSLLTTSDSKQFNLNRPLNIKTNSLAKKQQNRRNFRQVSRRPALNWLTSHIVSSLLCPKIAKSTSSQPILWLEMCSGSTDRRESCTDFVMLTFLNVYWDQNKTQSQHWAWSY